ncbi:Ras family protein [Purpureocillium lavendulum]|uniref:Ras family protein n=1 Tax=Purpureocillium lavendulum TaxID=1247861 RepID=A0AB34G6P0_9HYPO|nr:Ras family protein [Purpureocillium lavendulum]
MSPVLLLLLAVLGHAYTVPIKPKDGIYIVTRDTAGNDVHTEISGPKQCVDASPSHHYNYSAPYPRAVLRREDGDKRVRTTWCGCKHHLDKKDFHAAGKNLYQQVKQHPQLKTPSLYSISGSVVAFICKKDPKKGPPSIQLADIGYMATMVQNACGPFVAGTFLKTYGIEDPPILVGYMQANKGLDFCKEAMGSDEETCKKGGTR